MMAALNIHTLRDGGQTDTKLILCIVYLGTISITISTKWYLAWVRVLAKGHESTKSFEAWKTASNSNHRV